MAAPIHSENALLIAKDSINKIETDSINKIETDSTNTTAADSITSGMLSERRLSELSAALDELQPLASKIAYLKQETLEKEAAVLKAILKKAAPLVPLLSDDREQHCRREIVILAKEERIQLEKGQGFFSEHKLILYENGVLVRLHRYGEWSEDSQLGWEDTDEDVLTPDAAIIAFGFTAVSNGLIKVLGDAPSMATLKEKLEGDLATLTKALEALRKRIG